MISDNFDINSDDYNGDEMMMMTNKQEKKLQKKNLETE